MKKTPAKNNKSISLKEYFDTRFEDFKNYFDVKFQNIEKATMLAQENLNTRLESMNEFRSSMKDQTQQYITKAEHATFITKVDSDIRYLRENAATVKGKASQQAFYVAVMIGIISIIISIASLIIKN
jgi:hypothetical protein